MAEILKRALIPELLKYIDKARLALPGLVLSLIAQAQTWLPTTIAKANAIFSRLYADAAGRVGAWLPSTAPAVTKTGEKLLDKIAALVKKG